MLSIDSFLTFKAVPFLFHLSELRCVLRITALLCGSIDGLLNGFEMEKQLQNRMIVGLFLDNKNTDNTWYISNTTVTVFVFINYYIMAGHAIVVVKDINLLFHHGNAVILTLW